MKNLSRVTAIIIMLTMLVGIASISALASDEITVLIDGQPVQFADQEAVIVDGRTLVPVRGVFEQLGFVVNWNPQTQQATLSGDDAVIIITIGSNVFTTNGTSYTLDVSAQTIGGRTMLPLRLVLESVAMSLDWISETFTVVITSGGAGEQTPITLPAPAPTVPPNEGGTPPSVPLPSPAPGEPTEPIAPPDANHPLIGRWQDDGGFWVDIFADGRTENYFGEYGTWSVEGNTLTIITEAFGEETHTFVIQGDRLVIDENETDPLTRVR